jgi:hypothetical protein
MQVDTHEYPRVRFRSKLSFVALLVVWSLAASAASSTFQGLLLPASFDPPIPITVLLSESYGQFSGRVKTSLPLAAEGRIASGQRDRDRCSLTSDLGSGMRLKLEGKCMPNSLDGKYKIWFADGRHGEGTFKVQAMKADNEKQARPRDVGSDSSSSLTTSACLRVNAGCLAACPRGADNGELICVNACTRRLSACKNNAIRLPAPPASGG